MRDRRGHRLYDPHGPQFQNDDRAERRRVNQRRSAIYGLEAQLSVMSDKLYITATTMSKQQNHIK